MCTVLRAINFKKEFLNVNPHLKDEVNDYFSLMIDEIDDGASTEHEIDLFIGACEDLLVEEN